MGDPGREPGTSSLSGLRNRCLLLPCALRAAARVSRRCAILRFVTTEPSPKHQYKLGDLIVRHASTDLLDVEPIDLGPGAPMTAALEAERGPEPSAPQDAG